MYKPNIPVSRSQADGDIHLLIRNSLILIEIEIAMAIPLPAIPALLAILVIVIQLLAVPVHLVADEMLKTLGNTRCE